MLSTQENNTQQKDMLLSALDSLGEDYVFTEQQIEKIHIYLNELQKWNKVYNLSGFKSLEDHVYRNLLDCIVVAPFIDAKHLMDLGTGAGLPGLLLAILKPQQQWVLLDGNGKKTRFLQQVKQLLKLDNVEVVHSRVENYQPQQKFNAISSRAFSKIPDSLLLCESLFEKNALFYALKGKVLDEDISNLPAWASLQKIEPIVVPGIKEERHLIIIDIQQNA